MPDPPPGPRALVEVIDSVRYIVELDRVMHGVMLRADEARERGDDLREVDRAEMAAVDFPVDESFRALHRLRVALCELGDGDARTGLRRFLALM